MKRSILLGVLGMGSMVAAYGQGQLSFANYNASTQLNGITYANGPAAGLGVGPEISVTLLYGVSTDTSISQLTPLASSTTVIGLGAATGPGPINVGGFITGAGVFSGGAVTVPSLGGTAIPGGTYAFAEVATGMYLGITYTGDSAIFHGTTSAVDILPPTTLPAGLFDGSFTVSSIPEPTTLALGGLGLAGLLMARRKKA
jgi:hypothetical protein